MFTGIITGVGRIAAIHDLGSSLQHGKRLTIETPAGYLDDVGLGDSIALNGACMTVTTLDAPSRRFTIDISAESLARTAGLDQPGPVNLEIIGAREYPLERCCIIAAEARGHMQACLQAIGAR